MVDHVKRTIWFVRQIETAFKNTGWFELVKDGMKKDEKDQWEGHPSFYTRVYRMRLDGEYCCTWVKFVYDERDDWADFTLHCREPNVGRVSAREFASRKLVRALVSTK